MATALEIVQQDPDLAESTFLEADDVTLATVLHVAFPAPAGTLSGTQKFRRRVRKTAGSPSPTLDMWLYEDGVAVRKLLDAVPITSAIGQVVEGEWQPNEITNPALVECYCISTPGAA